MKKAIIFGIAFAGIIFIQASYAQSCKRVHNFCSDNISDEDDSNRWLFDNQSKSASFEKGKVYEMAFIAYKNFNYRLSTCTDIVEAGQNVEFEVFVNKLVRKEVNGKLRLLKEKTSIYKNTTDNLASFHKFRVGKTQKIFVKVTVPSSGESSAKSLKNSEYVCVGVLIEHSRAQKTGF